MELTAENVQKTVMSCLYETPPADQSEAVIVKGIVANFGFDPKKLEAQKDNIESMLSQLPKEFFEKTKGGGSGWSFLNACLRSDDVQWGEHRSMDELFCLGMAIKKVEFFPSPREVWSLLPGGMPYLVIKDIEPQATAS